MLVRKMSAAVSKQIKILDVPRRPTKNSHSGSVKNPKTFLQAYDAVLQNRGKVYKTNAGTPFTAEARITSKGPHEGEEVIIFKQDAIEMARSYECCWGKQTNCNRTYIDSYTPRV
jgi:hypothetical protein